MRSLSQLVLSLTVAALVGSAASAATVLHLRTSCTDFSPCETTTGGIVDEIEALEPQESSRVLVRIGPGSFEPLAMDCDGDYGYTTFRGSGREATKLSGSSLGALIYDCPGLEFQDLTFEGGSYAVRWGGTGSAVWSETNLVGSAIAWSDVCNGSPSSFQSRHAFFGVRFLSRATAQLSNLTSAFSSTCAQSEIHASDIAVVGQSDSVTALSAVEGISVSHKAVANLYGTAVRVVTGAMPGTTSVSSITGAQVGTSSQKTGVLRMYGGVLEVNAESRSQGITGLSVIDGSGATAEAETIDASFALRAGSGQTATRLAGSKARSPFLWPQGSLPPYAAGEEGPFRLASVDGQDLFVETDCPDAPSTDPCTGGGQTHLFIYNATACTDANGGPWFDVVTGACREDIP